MRFYGGLERIARLPKRPGFLRNSDSSVKVLMPRTFFHFQAQLEFAHDEASRFDRHYKRMLGDRELAFGLDGLLFVGVVFFPTYVR